MIDARRTEPVSNVFYPVFNAAGNHIVADTGVTEESGGVAQIVDLDTGRVVSLQNATPCGPFNYGAFAWSANGQYVAGSSYCGDVTVWDTAGHLVRRIPTGADSNAPQFDIDPDGSKIVVATAAGAKIFSVATARVLHMLLGQAGGTAGAAFSPDGSIVMTTGNDDSLRLWDTATGNVLRILPYATGIGSGFSTDGKQIYVYEFQPGTPTVMHILPACPGCGDVAALLAEAATRQTDQLTPAERLILDEWRLKYRAVLALARAGSTEQAAEQYESYGLAAIEDEDTAALQARIAKDLALAASGVERTGAATRSAELYAAIHRRTGGYFPAINAATMSLFAGDVGESRRLAAEVAADLRQSPEDSYYAWATLAEAALLLDDPDQTREALARAAALADGDHGALSTTRRQLRLICASSGIDVGLLAALAVPGVVHFCGHLIPAPGHPGRFPAAAEAPVRERIAAAVGDCNPGWAYGALACGGDILWAEALLARGVELRVVLPFAQDEFVRESVASGGAGWIDRFHACLDAADRVDFATDGAYLDDVLFRYGTELAMGLAIQRARDLDTSVTQLALWDGAPAAGAAGTAIDVATWRERGLPSTVISVPAAAPVSAAVTEALPTPAPAVSTRPQRVVRAMLGSRAASSACCPGSWGWRPSRPASTKSATAFAEWQRSAASRANCNCASFVRVTGPTTWCRAGTPRPTCRGAR